VLREAGDVEELLNRGRMDVMLGQQQSERWQILRGGPRKERPEWVTRKMGPTIQPAPRGGPAEDGSRTAWARGWRCPRPRSSLVHREARGRGADGGHCTSSLCHCIPFVSLYLCLRPLHLLLCHCTSPLLPLHPSCVTVLPPCVNVPPPGVTVLPSLVSLYQVAGRPCSRGRRSSGRPRPARSRRSAKELERSLQVKAPPKRQRPRGARGGPRYRPPPTPTPPLPSLSLLSSPSCLHCPVLPALHPKSIARIGQRPASANVTPALPLSGWCLGSPSGRSVLRFAAGACAMPLVQSLALARGAGLWSGHPPATCYASPPLH